VEHRDLREREKFFKRQLCVRELGGSVNNYRESLERKNPRRGGGSVGIRPYQERRKGDTDDRGKEEGKIRLDYAGEDRENIHWGKIISHGSNSKLEASYSLKLHIHGPEAAEERKSRPSESLKPKKGLKSRERGGGKRCSPVLAKGEKRGQLSGAGKEDDLPSRRKKTRDASATKFDCAYLDRTEKEKRATFSEASRVPRRKGGKGAGPNGIYEQKGGVYPGTFGRLPRHLIQSGGIGEEEVIVEADDSTERG